MKTTLSLLTAAFLIPFFASALPGAIRPAAPAPLKHNVIYRGGPIDEANIAWRSVVEFIYSGGNCTATIIGQRTLITAA